MTENGNFLSKLNLPTLLLGSAGEAIAKLIGVPFETLRARLERPMKAIEARTEAQKVFQVELAKTLAKDAAANPLVAERALGAFARDLYGKQENKEAVAATAIELLESQPAVDPPKETVSDDWLNFFGSYAEKASSENMRKLWGAILAGEIRKPGAYSLITLRVLSELDMATAQRFEKIANLAIVGKWIPLINDELNARYDDIALLTECGLLRTYSPSEKLVMTLDEEGRRLIPFAGRKKALLLCGSPGSRVSMQGVGVQATGQQLLSLLNVEPSEQLASLAIGVIEKSGLESIRLVEIKAEGNLFTVLNDGDEVWPAITVLGE